VQVEQQECTMWKIGFFLEKSQIQGHENLILQPCVDSDWIP